MSKPQRFYRFDHSVFKHIFYIKHAKFCSTFRLKYLGTGLMDFGK